MAPAAMVEVEVDSAAAAITGGDPYKTTLQAWKYTLPAFLVPFVFVLDPKGLGLLMKIPPGGHWSDIVLITVIAAIGLGALACAAQGLEHGVVECIHLVAAHQPHVGHALVQAHADSLVHGVIPLL